jgi:hypothetical protein
MKTAINQAGSSVFTLLLTAVVTLWAIVVSTMPTDAYASSCIKRHTLTVCAAHTVCNASATPTYVIGKGSYYHKVVTTFGAYTGIEGEVTLPTPQIDPQRVGKSGKQLAGFSIYMGGNADGQEVDAGFSWEKNPDKSDANAPAMVWRPFARAKHWLDSDTKLTWSPGYTVRLSVTIIKDGVLRLSIDDVGVDRPRHYSRDFEAWRFRRGASCQFKRVNAIDQCGREGKSTVETNSKVVGAVWRNTYVLAGLGEKQVLHALCDVAHTQHDESAANIRVRGSREQQAAGGESVDVYGNAQQLAEAVAAERLQVTSTAKSAQVAATGKS